MVKLPLEGIQAARDPEHEHPLLVSTMTSPNEEAIWWDDEIQA